MIWWVNEIEKNHANAKDLEQEPIAIRSCAGYREGRDETNEFRGYGIKPDNMQSL